MNKTETTEKRLEGKVALITGGASGLGEGMCRMFATQGAAVAVADLNSDGSAAVAADIESAGGKAIALALDVRDRQSARDSVEKVLEAFGTIDILVNCAGVDKFGHPHEFTDDEWEWIRSVNLDGPWHMCQAVLTTMREKRSGKIINIGSASSLRARPTGVPYVVTKHGVAGLTKALALDVGPLGINVNCICPASVATPLLMNGTDEEYRDGMRKRLPLQRLGTIEDIAKAALFLVSSDADWITGITLPVDGGLNCCSAPPVVE